VAATNVYKEAVAGGEVQMKWRWVVLVAVGVLALGVVAALYFGRSRQGLTDPRAAGITSGNLDRVQVGMSVEEVNGIFGVPPGDYRSPPGFLLVGPGHIPRTEAARGGKLEIWYVPRAHAEVLFDRKGCVVGKYWYEEANR
jgi:hypothetical protein